MFLLPKSLRRFLLIGGLLLVLNNPSGRQLLGTVTRAARDAVASAVTHPAAGATTGDSPAISAGQSPQPHRHKVRAGETLLSIAHRYNTTVAELVRKNPQLATRLLVRAGMWILLP